LQTSGILYGESGRHLDDAPRHQKSTGHASRPDVVCVL
jgi:hypothetical protein